MKSIKEEYPNPVLAYGRDDYNEKCTFCTFLDEAKITVDDKNINIPIKYSLVCKGLTNLINSGDAVFAIQVKSSAASYSKLFKFESDEKERTISIPKYDVVNKIDLKGLIIAAKHIKRFRCDGEFNELYFGKSGFIIRKGDILAIEDSKSIYLDQSELEKPIASIFYIMLDSNQESDIFPCFDDDKIEIHLKSELYKLYYCLKDFDNGSLNRSVMGIIVYPVLVEAISYIKGYHQNRDRDDFDDGMDQRRWFRVIDNKAKLQKINLEETDESDTTIADMLLNGVVSDSLKSIKDTLVEINIEDNQIMGEIE